jgi:hypothetical protein
MVGFSDAIDLIIRSSAVLGQMFVLNAINPATEEMKKRMFDTPAKKKEFYADVNNGGSSIIGPRGLYLHEPVFGKEMILYADIDMEMIIDAKWASDCTGHYARPDVTKLLIQEERYDTYETTGSPFDFATEQNLTAFEDDLERLLEEVEERGDERLKALTSDFVEKYGM